LPYGKESRSLIKKNGTIDMKKYLFILLLFTGFGILFAQKSDRITIEAASPDPTLMVRGPEKEVNVIDDPQWSKTDNVLALFTPIFGKKVKDVLTNLVAVQVDAKMKVTKVINRSQGGEKPKFLEALSLTIPTGGFVLVASDDDYKTRGYKKFLAENFHVGDVVKLRLNGQPTTIAPIEQLGKSTRKAALELDIDPMITVLSNRQVISGRIIGSDIRKSFQVSIAHQDVNSMLKTDKKGNFKGEVFLSKGVNYLEVKLKEGGQLIDQRPLVIFQKEKNNLPPEIILWIEQFPNAKVLTNDVAVESMLQRAKQAGFTAISLDVKGPEGFVSYRKNDLSGSPYITGMKNPEKQIKDTGFDLLESMLTHAHQLGLKVYASFNFFAEGNITAGDYAVLNQHKDWEEIVQRPEDKGKLLRISESAVGKEAVSGKRLVLDFVNPANKAVQDFELLRVAEVLKNYPVDGIVMDRCRYDNLYADFSHVTRNAFADYLQSEGKHLNNFPNDAFYIDENGNMIKGKYFVEWITFRSKIIKSFTDRLRALINQYKRAKNSKLKLASYVGSWYEIYYQNGVNWASSSFTYNDKLDFPESEIYTDHYYKTSYLDDLDFLMIGTYYKTEKEVKKYITLGNVLTNGQVPLIGSISLPDLNDSEQDEVFKASLSESAGLMIFDLCYVNWASFLNQIKSALNNNK